jgi:hypothetical protein
MPTDGLLVIASVRAGKEEHLRRTLNVLGNDIRGTHTSDLTSLPRIEFGQGCCIHFARLALLDDSERGQGRKRLLLSTDYDGDWQDHVAELIGLTHQPEEIWGCCEGYSGAESFPQFIRAHTIHPETYYIAFQETKLAAVRSAIDVRESFQQALADPAAHPILEVVAHLFAAIKVLRKCAHALLVPLQSIRGVFLMALGVIRLMRQQGTRPVFNAAMQVNASLDRLWWSRWLNVVFANRRTPAPHRYTQAHPVAPPGPLTSEHPPEDAVLQNQLTLLTVIRPEYERHLRALLPLIDLYGRTMAPTGSLLGISTIHTVRWAIIDQGRRLLMVSNYDGTWENYIDEFAEMILSGLDALWMSAPGYPVAGAQDVEALKQFLRSHQIAANVFYSAYPEASVLNVKTDLQFSAWFGWLWRWLTKREAGSSTAAETVRP